MLLQPNDKSIDVGKVDYVMEYHHRPSSALSPDGIRMSEFVSRIDATFRCVVIFDDDWLAVRIKLSMTMKSAEEKHSLTLLWYEGN